MVYTKTKTHQKRGWKNINNQFVVSVHKKAKLTEFYYKMHTGNKHYSFTLSQKNSPTSQSQFLADTRRYVDYFIQ